MHPKLGWERSNVFFFKKKPLLLIEKVWTSEVYPSKVLQRLLVFWSWICAELPAAKRSLASLFFSKGCVCVCCSLFQWHLVHSAGRLRSNCNIRGSPSPPPIFVNVDFPWLKRLHLCHWQMKSDLCVHRTGGKKPLVIYCCSLDAVKCMVQEGNVGDVNGY